MKVFLTKLTKINNQWEDGFYWRAYDEEWQGMASAVSKEELINICKNSSWKYQDYIPPKRKRLDPVTYQPIEE